MQSSECLLTVAWWRLPTADVPEQSPASATNVSLLTTANLNWLNKNSKSELCYDRRSVGQSVLVSGTHLGPKTTFLLLSDICGFVDVGRPLWREDGSVVYNCCWSSPAQSFSSPSPAVRRTLFYRPRHGPHGERVSSLLHVLSLPGKRVHRAVT
jgi:hypothetical protein